MANQNIPTSRFNVGDIITIIEDGVEEQLLLHEKHYMPPANSDETWEAGYHFLYTSPDDDYYGARMNQDYVSETYLINHLK